MSKDLRIAFLCFGAAGLKRFGLALAEAVGRIPDTKVMVLVDRQDVELAQHALTVPLGAEMASVVVVDVWSRFRPFVPLNILRALYRFRPNVVHDTSGDGSRFVSVWPCIRVSYPLFITLHDPVPHVGIHIGVRARLKMWLLRNFATRVVVLGASRPTSPGWTIGATSKFVQSRLGCLDVCRENDAVRSNAQRPPRALGKQIVLFFGILRFNKGFDLLIPIADEVAKKRSDVLFLVAGGFGGERGWAGKRDAILADMRSRSDFLLQTGFIPDSEVPGLFAMAAATILPYRDATTSGVMFSAMKYGCPIVATDIPGLTATLTNGETASLVPLSVPDLAEALLKALAKPDLAEQRSMRARELLQRVYSWDSIAADILPAYRSARGTNRDHGRDSDSRG